MRIPIIRKRPDLQTAMEARSNIAATQIAQHDVHDSYFPLDFAFRHFGEHVTGHGPRLGFSIFPPQTEHFP